jgi:cation transport ATPase
VGISVDGAVDVAREAADLVLLEHDLRVLVRGIRQGRTTFVNSQKYILSTTSANFGNMLSMAAASGFLPFLPLTAAQILLNNLLTCRTRSRSARVRDSRAMRFGPSRARRARASAVPSPPVRVPSEASNSPAGRLQ